MIVVPSQQHQVAIAGEFKIHTRKLINGKFTKKKLRREQFNTVTDQGAHWFFMTKEALLAPIAVHPIPQDFYCRMSTGTSDIVKTDISLAGSVSGYVGLNNDNNARPGGPNFVDNLDGTGTYTDLREFVFAPGSVTGTWGQVGVFYATLVDDLFAGQRFKDNLGDPVSETFADNEEVTVSYSIKITAGIPDAVTPLTFAGATVLGTLNQTIKTVPTDIDVLSANSIYDSKFGGNTSGNSFSMMATHISSGLRKIRLMEDDGAGNLSELTLSASAASPVKNTLIFGRQYKITTVIQVPYDEFVDRYIRAVTIYNSNSSVMAGYNRTSWLRFLPSILKEAGEELNLEWSVLIDIT